MDRHVRATVNGAALAVLIRVVPDLAAGPAARLVSDCVTAEARFRAAERWGPGELSGTFPTYTWAPAGSGG